jgi:hypothetical protein
MSVKYVVLALGIFLLAFSSSLNAAEQGFLEGHLKIILGMAAQQSDDMPRPEVKPQSYAEYPLVVLSQDEKKEIARVTADENGNYRVALAPGNYLLDVQDRVRKHVRGQPQSFRVLANQIVHVDMNIVVGIHPVW